MSFRHGAGFTEAERLALAWSRMQRGGALETRKGTDPSKSDHSNGRPLDGREYERSTSRSASPSRPERSARGLERRSGRQERKASRPGNHGRKDRSRSRNNSDTRQRSVSRSRSRDGKRGSRRSERGRATRRHDDERRHGSSRSRSRSRSKSKDSRRQRSEGSERYQKSRGASRSGGSDRGLGGGSHSTTMHHGEEGVNSTSGVTEAADPYKVMSRDYSQIPKELRHAYLIPREASYASDDEGEGGYGRAGVRTRSPPHLRTERGRLHIGGDRRGSRSRSSSRHRGTRRSISTSRSRSVSRSRSSSRDKERRMREEKWGHDRFAAVADTSPVRPVVPPGYRPPSPEWVSRAGGVAIMRKNRTQPQATSTTTTSSSSISSGSSGGFGIGYTDNSTTVMSFSSRDSGPAREIISSLFKRKT